MAEMPDMLPLAAEFPPATEPQWRALVESVLKGARFEDRLQSRSADGLVIEPLYRRAAATALASVRAPGQPWQVMQRIDHPDPHACNAECLHELENGANGLVLIPVGAIGARGYGFAPGADAIERMLAGIHLDAGISVTLEFSPHAPNLALDLARLVEQRKLAPTATAIGFGIDPLGAFARHGCLPEPWPAVARQTADAVADLIKRGFKGPFCAADGRVVHDAGGTEAQELAFVLTAAVAYLRALESGGIPLETARRAIELRLTADADQFLTIAKFRALRRLWQRVEESCGLKSEPIVISAETAWRSMTRDDAYANILRATIAVFAASVGGADAISVLPFTQARGLPDHFARRVARNLQHVLIDETGVGRVGDPTAGTGWSEDLTGKLCASAWTLFQEIEASGGAADALERGLIQQKVAAARTERERALAAGTQTLVGANAFPDSAPAKVAVLDVVPPNLPELSAAIRAEPLKPVRFAAPFEISSTPT